MTCSIRKPRLWDLMTAHIKHGRLKVKTSEEQAEAKRLEREQKLKLYQSATQAVFQKRQAGELDESVLELTSQILGANPDFATLWNCRREVLQQLEAQKSPEELAALVKAELVFLESCLRVNPKSYGTWHHRCWLLGRLPEPNWARELELCARFLEVDERNFHCWDYRRFVAAQAAVPPAEELAFTDSLITRNFSNYSSWHYRSCLLPQLHPQPDSGPQGRLPEDVLLKELELVQNAFFTDPNDQSAWFYHRWLLGRGRQEAWCRDSATDEQLFRCELSVEKSTVLQSELKSCKELQELEPENKCKVHSLKGCSPRSLLRKPSPRQSLESSKDLTRMGAEEDPRDDLNSCPPSGCLLTIILLMRALDPLLYEKETLQYFQTLKASWAYGNSPGESKEARGRPLTYAAARPIPCRPWTPCELPTWTICAASSCWRTDLTVLCHLEQLLLVTHLDLSHNRLRTLPPALAALRCLQVLQASDNSIESLDSVANLPQLQELSLCNNPAASSPSLLSHQSPPVPPQDSALPLSTPLPERRSGQRIPTCRLGWVRLSRGSAWARDTSRARATAVPVGFAKDPGPPTDPTSYAKLGVGRFPLPDGSQKLSSW
ncbi:Geranylgeranyl transferase type-2 subunit alpha [Fukomys damarensis]|uniref:Geranylgeranyl transferase type-2 subunit alpha n=1 Tax=Fukomys damarensis TaxID=885580 RepID=A0A091EA34_FUKDA|nr:Geranylgeranyl transferase type-2 subunit alpha [Fukomys damarensis]